MRVTVVPYDSRWPTAFDAEAARLVDAVGEIFVAIHHIGSTAIPGLHAKPIIDILLEVDELSRLDARRPAFEELGYEALGEFGIPGRRYFRRNDDAGTRTHQIHAFAVGTPNVERHLAFRDYMIAHPAEAAVYGALKQELARDRPTIEEYVAGKDAYVKEQEARAIAWWRDGSSGRREV